MERKIFIIGLPRTGTTSLCVTLLTLGYRVAHTAYTVDCLTQAEVIADTPVFCDFAALAEQYPQAKFIYLDRQLTYWIPSIRQLLQRMYRNISRHDGGFNPILKRCYKSIFSPFTLENIAQNEFLVKCYEQHQQAVIEYFSMQPERLLRLDLTDDDGYRQLLTFLQIAGLTTDRFANVNQGSKITYWNSVKHPLKIDALYTCASSLNRTGIPAEFKMVDLKN